MGSAVSAFTPSLLQSTGHLSTELNARPKLATKKAGAGKKTVAAKGGKDAPAISFPKVTFPWDSKPEPVEKVSSVKKSTGRAKLGQKSPTISDRIFNMDLYAPVANQNDYGARKGKKLTQGKLSQKSYVPAGMSKAQYEKIRSKDKRKKDDTYAYNVEKQGRYNLFYEFYKNRGTDTKENWRDVTNKHTMAKTKYDWQGDNDMAGGGSGGSRFTGR